MYSAGEPSGPVASRSPPAATHTSCRSVVFSSLLSHPAGLFFVGDRMFPTPLLVTHGTNGSYCTKSLLIVVMSCKRWLLPERKTGQTVYLVDPGTLSKSTNLLDSGTTCHQPSPTTWDPELLQATLPSMTRAVPSTRLRRSSRHRSSRVPDRLLQFSQ